jgi:DNA topoisomerase-1
MRRRGKGFELFDARGRKLTGEASHERVAALVIPPAWQDVWISPSENGHIQAMGIDGAGRRQYIYHQAWTASRSRAKFKRMGDFAVSLDDLRASVDRDLEHTDLTRAAVLAGCVRLLDIGFFRVGSERYAAQNKTFGLTTLRREHATVKRDGTLVFDYTAKHGKHRVQRASDPQVSDLVKRLKARRSDPDPRLFASRDNGSWHAMRAVDVNAYLKDHTGTSISAKDFRTWSGTVLAAALLAQTEVPASRTARERAATGVIRQVADSLGNTLAVARSSYVDPRVVDRWSKGETIALSSGDVSPEPELWTVEERQLIEAQLMQLLDVPKVKAKESS